MALVGKPQDDKIYTISNSEFHGSGRFHEPSSNHFAVRNTFLELKQDSNSLQEWCGSVRRVKSSPDLANPDAFKPCYVDQKLGEPTPAIPAPELCPSANSHTTADPGRADESQPNASRTRLSSQATPFQSRGPQKVLPAAHSTTYYAVPKSRTAQEQVVGMPSMLPLPTQALQQPIPPISSPTTAVIAPVILGSAMLPSIGSGGHATGECKPCVFFHKKGCATGRTCLFCHLCQPGEKQRRKERKEKSLSCIMRGERGESFMRVVSTCHVRKPSEESHASTLSRDFGVSKGLRFTTASSLVFGGGAGPTHQP